MAAQAPPPLQFGGPSIFQGAPATQLIAVVAVLSFLVIHSQHAASFMAFDSHALRTNPSHHWHRYGTSLLTYGTVGELTLAGSLTSFLARKMERELGSRKFVAFYLYILAAAVLTESAVVALDLVYPAVWRYAGPYSVLAALFHLFHRFSPRLYPNFIALAGHQLSEKSFYYLWFALAVTVSGKNTVAAAAVGWAAAFLYSHAPPALQQHLDVPDRVASVGSKLAERFLTLPPRMLVPAPGNGGNGGNGNGTGNGGLRRADPPAHPVFGQAPPPQATPRAVAAAQQDPVVADPAAIEQLLLMGFDQQQVVEALQYSNNNVNRAADRLLTQL
jgi:hypothetical protein